MVCKLFFFSSQIGSCCATREHNYPCLPSEVQKYWNIFIFLCVKTRFWCMIINYLVYKENMLYCKLPHIWAKTVTSNPVGKDLKWLVYVLVYLNLI